MTWGECKAAALRKMFGSDGGRIDVTDDLGALEITPDIVGVFDPESSVYVLVFEPCDP